MKANPKVKICGITRVEDARVAASSGADAIGIVFFEKSPRNVADLAVARDIAKAVGPFVTVVGLFVDASEHFVREVLSQVPLNCLQFHGNESEEYCQSFERPYVKALRMKPGANIELLAKDYPSARGILLDAYVKGLPGGTGTQFDWSLTPSLSQSLILAGGLDQKNIEDAIRIAQPYAVDVSGGVEDAPGIKSAAKIKEFIETVKSEKVSG